MKQYINQNIQFIEYDGKPETITFKATFDDSEWSNFKTQTIKTEYGSLILPIQTNLDSYKAALAKELANATPNQNTINQLQTSISSLSGQIASLKTQMDNEITLAKNEYPYGDKIIEENSIVWVNHPLYTGAYIVQKKKWIKMSTATTLYTKGTKKLYATDGANPAYMVNDLTNPSDSFNQIPILVNDGYILLSQNPDKYVLYEYQNLDNAKTYSHVIFNIPKCMEDNNLISNFVDNINKVLTFDELLGVCDNFEQASILLSFDVYNLSPDTTYTIRLNSTNNNIRIENNEIILDNFDNKQKSFSSNIKFLNEITNSVFHVYLSLYSNEILVDKDVVSIFVNCPKKPDPTPLPAKIKTNISIV